jgi:hypothetical protein
VDDARKLMWRGIQHHLGKGDHLDICLLIPVLRFQRQFGIDSEDTGIVEVDPFSEEVLRAAEEAAKAAHIKNAIMAGLYFGQDASGKAKKLEDVLEEKKKSRIRPTVQLGSKLSSGGGGQSDVLTKVCT